MEDIKKMKLKTSVRPNNYYNVFPEKRDFYLLDKEENIKNFKKTNMNDPEYIFVFTENEKKEFHENIYKRKDFLADYDFVKIETKKPEVYINCLIPKSKFNIAKETRLLTEIMKRPLFIEDIYRKTKINLNTKKDIAFKEVFNIPTEKRFYTKILILDIYDRNLTKPPSNQNQNGNKNFINNNNNVNNFPQQNINFNINNNNFMNYFNNNNNFSAYKNNDNTNEKVHLKGHTGFF